MARRASGWTCLRQAGGVKCGHKNRPRTRRCAACGKPRPVKRRPKHMVALAVTYEDYTALNGGKEECGICGAPPPDTRRLDRDHDHATGLPRGLLCRRCNRLLSRYHTLPWMHPAVQYLQRHLERTARRQTP